MKHFLLPTLLFQAFQPGFAHYVFSYLIVNETISKEWQYVRDVTVGSKYDPSEWGLTKVDPNYDLYSNNIRCGRDGHLSGKGTQTATVVAGSEIGVRINGWNQGSYIFHTGPLQAYLSKATTPDIQSYTDDGDWVCYSPPRNFCPSAEIGVRNQFKIKYFGPILNSTVINRNWEAAGTTGVNFEIPKTTPPGKYLLRVEQIYISLSQSFNTSQFYLNCAQIEVVGEGGGTPGPLVKFPGAYDYFDPSLWTPNKVDLATYIPPGPLAWSG